MPEIPRHDEVRRERCRCPASHPGQRELRAVVGPRRRGIRGSSAAQRPSDRRSRSSSSTTSTISARACPVSTCRLGGHSGCHVGPRTGARQVKVDDGALADLAVDGGMPPNGRKPSDGRSPSPLPLPAPLVVKNGSMLGSGPPGACRGRVGDRQRDVVARESCARVARHVGASRGVSRYEAPPPGMASRALRARFSTDFDLAGSTWSATDRGPAKWRGRWAADGAVQEVGK